MKTDYITLKEFDQLCEYRHALRLLQEFQRAQPRLRARINEAETLADFISAFESEIASQQIIAREFQTIYLNDETIQRARDLIESHVAKLEKSREKVWGFVREHVGI